MGIKDHKPTRAGGRSNWAIHMIQEIPSLRPLLKPSSWTVLFPLRQIKTTEELNIEYEQKYANVSLRDEQLEKIKQSNANVITHNIAVSNHVGTNDFYVDDKRLSNSSFQNLVGGQKITVDTVTIDSLQLVDVGFIKVDVEGVELDVLVGANDTIEEYKPTCMVEVYDKFNKYPVETTFEFFFNRGYRCFYNHRAEGLKPVRDIAEGIEATKIPQITDGDFLFTI